MNIFNSDKKLPDSFVDITGTVLSPGRPDICRGNGKTVDDDGNLIECCCDECNWLLACLEKMKRYD